MQLINCPYCGRPAEFVNSNMVYGGKGYGMIYLCSHCNAYVGVHNGTDKPFGRLANAELRKWKQAAHAQFDPIWQSNGMKRKDAYRWLSEQMQIPFENTHIGMFDIEQCRQVIQIIRRRNSVKPNNHDGAAYCRP